MITPTPSPQQIELLHHTLGLSPRRNGCRSCVAPGAGCRRKVAQCTVRLEGGKVCEASRRVLDKKFNMEC